MEANGTTKHICDIYMKDGHHANQCPTKEVGKALIGNMVTVEVQKVTTRSKTKQSEWETQEAIQKVPKEWVEEANKNNADRILQKNKERNDTPVSSEIS